VSHERGFRVSAIDRLNPLTAEIKAATRPPSSAPFSNVNFRIVVVTSLTSKPQPVRNAASASVKFDCAATTNRPVSVATVTGGSVTSMPPVPSLAMLKLPATYWPSSRMFAVCEPSVTLSVPLDELPE